MKDQSSRTRCSKSLHLRSVRARLLKSLTNATTGGPTRLFSSRRVRASPVQLEVPMLPSFAISLDLGDVSGSSRPSAENDSAKPKRESAPGSTSRHFSFSCALCSIFGIAVAVMIIIVARAGASYR